MREYRFYVYIMFNHRNGTLYVGMTNNIYRRINEHKSHINPDSFTARYNCDKLGYYEEYNDVNNAISREKELKAGPRCKKIELIESMNPDWRDLAE